MLSPRRQAPIPHSSPCGLPLLLVVSLSLALGACGEGDSPLAPTSPVADDAPVSASRGPTGQACVGCPVVTSHILYSRINPSGNRDIYIMNPDGTARTVVAATIADETEPAWSPNYTRLVFSRERKGQGAGQLDGLWTIGWNGSSAVRVTTSAADRGASWGKTNRIVFHSTRDNPLTTANEIYTINPDGTGLLRLTNGAADDRDPAWSPDGTKIVFASNRSLYSRALGHMHLWVMNADGTGLKQLTSGSDDESQPAWSPDGSRIAYHHTTGIAAIHPDGTKDNTIDMSGVEAMPGGVKVWYVGEPSWSPDGQSLAFTSNRNDVYRVYAWSPGFGLRLTPDGDQDRFPMWAR
jgi:Tol biopolymer transport system component